MGILSCDGRFGEAKCIHPVLIRFKHTVPVHLNVVKEGVAMQIYQYVHLKGNVDIKWGKVQMRRVEKC